MKQDNYGPASPIAFIQTLTAGDKHKLITLQAEERGLVVGLHPGADGRAIREVMKRELKTDVINDAKDKDGNIILLEAYFLRPPGHARQAGEAREHTNAAMGEQAEGYISQCVAELEKFTHAPTEKCEVGTAQTKIQEATPPFYMI